MAWRLLLPQRLEDLHTFPCPHTEASGMVNVNEELVRFVLVLKTSLRRLCVDNEVTKVIRRIPGPFIAGQHIIVGSSQGAFSTAPIGETILVAPEFEFKDRKSTRLNSSHVK